MSNQYNKLVVNSVRLLNYIFGLPKLLNQQSTSPSIEQRKRIEKIYRYVFPFVVDPKYSWDSYYQMIEHFTDLISSADEDDDEYSNCEIPSDDDSVDSEKYKLDDQMPITAFFTEEEINQNKYKTVVGPFTLRLDKAVNSMMSSMIDKFMRDNLGRAKICYNTAERVLDCRCPDLLCASCMMYYVARHNEVEYRECATPGCHQMFIVDNPLRKHCDKHIEPLRRKRENQRAVKKSQKETNANKEINQLQSYLGELIDGSDMLSVADNTDRFVVCTKNGSSFTITIQKN